MKKDKVCGKVKSITINKNLQKIGILKNINIDGELEPTTIDGIELQILIELNNGENLIISAKQPDGGQLFAFEYDMPISTNNNLYDGLWNGIEFQIIADNIIKNRILKGSDSRTVG